MGSVLDLRRSVGLVLLLGVVAAAGVLAAGQPIAAALVVAAVTAFTGLTNGWSAGSYALAPVLAIVFAATDRGLPWWSAAAWSIAGGLIGLVVLRLMKVDSEPSPCPSGTPGAMRSRWPPHAASPCGQRWRSRRRGTGSR